MLKLAICRAFPLLPLLPALDCCWPMAAAAAAAAAAAVATPPLLRRPSQPWAPPSALFEQALGISIADGDKFRRVVQAYEERMAGEGCLARTRRALHLRLRQDGSRLPHQCTQPPAPTLARWACRLTAADPEEYPAVVVAPSIKPAAARAQLQASAEALLW